MKINVTGSAGAGKTTYAKYLSRELDIPAYHLDSIVWQPHWKKTPQDQRQQLELELTSQPQWIIDGVSDHIRKEADLVVVLTTSRLRCLFQAFRRNLPYLFRSRPGLPDHCPEILILPTLIRLIMSYPRTLKQVLSKEAARSTKYVFLSTDADYSAILQHLQTGA